MNEITEEVYKPRGSPYSFGQYALLIVVLTPVTAGLLAFYGFIPFNILQAVLSGLAFSLVYVSYRWYYAKQYRKDDIGLINDQ